MTAAHIPVLLEAVLAALTPRQGETHVDGTYGAGGYTSALLASGARVYAFDRDPQAIALANAQAAGEARLTVVPERFGRLDTALAERGVAAVDGVVLDIGVSSMQLDQADRGFSFQADGPLDMRMEQAGPSAADFVNGAEEGEIARVLAEFGEEPRARRIARAIVAARPITRTAELATVVRRAIGQKPGDPRDAATRTFQGLRIHVNRELDELADGLEAAERALGPGGRLAVVTFHSLEDRLVKRFLKTRSGSLPAGSRHRPSLSAAHRPSFAAVARPVRPGAAEIARNPRSRSATLRVARRTDASPWPARVAGVMG
jgi:16S rRNA (cytosine1402-N4)-methyltransferase